MNNYRNLLFSIVTSFLVMYALTYIAVYTWGDISIFSTRSLYMAMIMIAPMIMIMIIFMGNMYKNKQLNMKLYAFSVGLFFISLFFIRGQVFVNDTQFLRSMIPHHSSAITMCRESSLSDPEVIELCESIITAQQQEIDQMNSILKRLKDN
tara:strand:+ start:208230 stop:208682 length:453 start_codon:yes stop_codon:yes gene_type:complete